MSRTNVNPNVKMSNSDVLTLTDIDTQKSLSLITTDSEGNFNWRGITRAPLVRNAMQTSTSSNKYSDLELPWISIADEDWTGGRGQLLFNEDTTRFYDSKRVQSAFKGIYNAPLDFYSNIREQATNCPRSLKWINFQNNVHLVQRITTEGSWNAEELYLHLRKRGNPDPDSVVKVYVSTTETASSSDPVAVISAADFTDTLAEFRKLTLSYPASVASTMYLTFVTDEYSGDDNNCIQLGVTSKTAETTIPCNDRNWEILYRLAPEQDGLLTKFFTYEQLVFCVRNEPNDVSRIYINGLLGCASSATGTTIVQGTEWADDIWKGAQLGLVYGTGVEDDVTVWHDIVSNEYDSISQKSTITIADEFGITPAAGTCYIINNTPVWMEIPQAVITTHITDIEVIRGNVYLCQGDDAPVLRMHFDKSTCAFAFETLSWNALFLRSVRDSEGLMLWRGQNNDAESKRSLSMTRLIDRLSAAVTICSQTTAVTTTGGSVACASVDYGHGDTDCSLYKMIIETFTSTKNEGKFLATLQGSDDNSSWTDVKSFDTVIATGTYYMFTHCPYRYRRMFLTTTGDGGSVSKITITSEVDNIFVQDYNLTLLDNYGKITGLMEYGSETEKSLWVMQEGMLSSVNKYSNNGANTYTLDRINIDELQTTAEEWNAKTFITSDVYLAFSWLNGIQRYYNTQLEGKGVDRDEGLPIGRRGRVSKLLSYPSHFFASIDGGDDGLSAVYMFNQSGWHQLYSAPNVGERIRDMEFQPIYGPNPDRLWMAVGDDIVYLAMPSKTLEALKDEHALYTHESVLVSAWMNAGMTDIPKLWHSMKIMADYLDGEICWVEADYQVDDEPEWHPVENWYVESPSPPAARHPHGSVNGKKFRYRLRLQTTDNTKTPRVNVVVLEAVGHVDIKYSYSFAVRNILYKADLNGEYENIEPIEVQNLLDEWANEIKKLKLNCRYRVFDDKTVYLDAVQTSVLQELSEGYIVQMTLNEL